MLLLLVFLCVWCCFLLPTCFTLSPLVRSHDYKFVKINENSTIYLLNRGYRQIISFLDKSIENKTVQIFGVDVSTLPIISLQELGRYPEHPTKVIPIVQADNSPDEIMRVYKLKAATLQRNEKLLQNLTKFGNYINPPLAIFEGTCISLTVDAPCSPPKRTMNVILPMDSTCTKVDLNASFKNTTPGYTVQHPRENEWIGEFAEANWKSVLTCEDPRIIMLPNQRLLAVFTDGYVMHGSPRLGVAILAVNTTNGIPEFSRRHELILKDHPREGQKNWTPFVHGDKAMFIVHINPFTVGTLSSPFDLTTGDGLEHTSHKQVIEVDLISKAPKIELNWTHGHLRGGTPAHLINNDEYLAIFHSSLNFHFGRITFFMGALTFSSHPPFRLKRVSSAPLIHDDFYEGAWFKRKYDYIIYPMGYIFLKGDKKSNELYEIQPLQNESDVCNDDVNILLTIGRQDVEGWTTKINLRELLDSMQYVKYPDDETSGSVDFESSPSKALYETHSAGNVHVPVEDTNFVKTTAMVASMNDSLLVPKTQPTLSPVIWHLMLNSSM